MTLEELAAFAPQRGKTPYVGISDGIVNQIRAKGISQAQIAVNVPKDKEFAAFRGPVVFNVPSLGLESIVLFKNDSHSCWLSAQGAARTSEFEKVFNLLLEGLTTSDEDKFRSRAEFFLGDPEDDEESN